MKLIYEDKVNYILRLDNGDELIKELGNFCLEHRVTAGWLSALGACKELTLAYYNVDTKEYENHIVPGNLEVVSITGNLGVFKNNPIAHVHGVFSDNELKTVGGHVVSLIVSATLEIRVTILQGQISREFDDQTCLKLIRNPEAS